MKKTIIFFLCLTLMFSFFTFGTNASDGEAFSPYVIDFNLTSDFTEAPTDENNTRATGLIHSYSLYLTKTGSTLHITGQTHGSTEVVRSGFKDLVIQRRISSDYAWEDYYEYGDMYIDTWFANLDTTLAVATNYQYRISCKHYAKKNIFMVQTVSNVSNIVTSK